MGERHRPVWWNRRGDADAGDAAAEAIAGIRVDGGDEGFEGFEGAESSVTDLAGPDLSGLGPGLGAPLFGGLDP
jgi:hypothetical protein